MKFRFISLVAVFLVIAPIPAALSERLHAESPLEEYAGSASCAECHSDIYDKWSKRLKSSFGRSQQNKHKAGVSEKPSVGSHRPSVPLAMLC